ncbi:CHASE2 domain-containing protein [Paenibacillus thalictri]|uniref:Adenylate/guanylate cyclase domain-containing protein n=1 Tax=Paenibacillus thalictri TaxID=2527873 RepID=A0A4Q9DZI3_9BACL|nr:adenylate/guanylate cyclase domain-containing protein [Paenibacillus thalictri]TBL81338.1 adenylate/guanylate cyclase domain-containing protein [Paenibacillus thalictri]
MKFVLNKSAVIAAGNVLVVLICLFLFASGVLGVLSHAVYDFNMKNSMSHEPHEDIVVVGIDTESIKTVGPYPWDRKVYAKLIDLLEKAGAKVIAFDIELYTESNNPDSDKALAQELSKYKNIIVPSHADLEGQISRSTVVKKGELIMAEKVVQPIPIFASSVQKAHINAAFDDDGVVRNNWLQINSPDGIFPSMGFKAAEMAGTNVQPYLNLPTLPNHPKSEIAIKWDAGEYDFETIPFAKVLNGGVPASIFKDRIVFVGYTAPGSDEGITPIEKHIHMVYAHANIANQILKGTKVTFANSWIPILLAALAIAVIGLLTWRLKAIMGVLLVLVAVIALFAVQFFVFKSSSVFVDVVGVIISGLVAYVGNIAMKTYFETKQKNYITKQFGRYISPDLVKEIASSDKEIQLGGISKELTVLFLDVRGFTPLSEKLNPEEVVGFLNMMFDLITERALVNHGTIDKFIGDAAMILYNAPLDVPNHPYYAVKTAYDIQKGMEKVRADVLEKYGVTIAVGIGINTGNVVVGNIGSYLRVDYTAIGDNVNTAARIESNTSPNQVLVSEVTYELTKEYFEYNYAGEKLMKGKSVPLKLFEVLGVKGAPADAAERGDAQTPGRAS